MPTAQLKLFNECKVSLAALNRSYFISVYSHQDGTYIPGDQIQQLKFSQGQLRLDRLPILRPKFSRTTVSWRQRTAKQFTVGHVTFNKDGLVGYGTIAHGNCSKTATLYSVLATAVPPNVFTTQITKQRYPTGTDPDTLPANVWQPGLSVQLGYQHVQSSKALEPVVTLNQIPIAGEFTLLPNQKNQLNVSFNSDAEGGVDSQNADRYIAGQLTLSPSNHTFQGTISQTCRNRSIGSEVYLWKGASPQAQSALADAIQLSSADLLQDTDLNVNTLIALLPDDTVTSMSHTLLVENMKWSMGQDGTKKQWLSDFFGQNPPVLDSNRINLINPDLSWYQTDFAIPYLAKGMSTSSGSNPPPINLDDTQKAKLDYYLKTGLSQSKSYNAQSDGIYNLAYVLGQPRLQDYINNGGEKWAAQMFDVVSGKAMLDQVMTILHTDFTMTVANNYITLLSVLDPSGNYAQQYQKLLFGRLTLQSGLLGTTVQDEATTLNWLPDALTYLASTVSGSPTSLTDTDTPADFNQAAKNIQDAFTYFGDATSTAKAIFDALALYKGYSLAQQLTNAEEAFTKEYPTLSGVGKLFGLLAWAGGVFNTAIGFMNWNSDNDLQRAAVINKCVDLVLGLASAGIDLLNPYEGAKVALDNALAEAERLNGVVDDIISTLVPEDAFEATWRLQAVDAALELVDEEAQKFIEPAFWDNVFQNAATVVKAFSVAVTATTLVLNTIQFVRDIESGQPVQQTVLDGITAALTLGTLVIQIVDLAIEAVVCSVLSSVFALLGVILTIIELFLPQPAAPTPPQTFQNNYANPYINTLPSPPSSPAPERPLPNVKLIYNLA
ncbi:MAG: hypothetical protein KME07_05630 [Pegethrix bostrychoides GSE-TBD4-15B]|uniref:Uncharacterized protein n=1 Tax=Pegethrix bostrychoides GSE-TBD4-15B TaxID=2839662 RepID=A0A951P969_9CYAN|nr:hypothetical protein [Pegethrix bostrychoides GSE-TBD4-15B]